MTYFATAPRGTWGTWNGRPAKVPYGTHHARRLGTTTSACGAPAASWELFWDVSFTPDLETACGACARQVVRHR